MMAQEGGLIYNYEQALVRNKHKNFSSSQREKSTKSLFISYRKKTAYFLTRTSSYTP